VKFEISSADPYTFLEQLSRKKINEWHAHAPMNKTNSNKH